MQRKLIILLFCRSLLLQSCLSGSPTGKQPAPRQSLILYAWMDYIPRTALSAFGAQATNENHYATANPGAYTVIEPELFNNPIVFPPPEMIKRLDWYLTLSKSGLRGAICQYPGRLPYGTAAQSSAINDKKEFQ